MSPRSADLLAEADRKLEDARRALEAGIVASVVGIAYYACLYAARAALSEAGRYAKTHAGTWTLFSEQFVRTGRFDGDLAAEARRLQRLREGADYEAVAVAPEEARAAVDAAERFVAAVRATWP